MNYKQSMCAALLSAFVSLPALADLGNAYASGKIGWAWENITTIDNTSLFVPELLPAETSTSGNALSYGGSVGYRFNTFYVPIRLEVDYTNRNNTSYNPNPIYLGHPDHLKSTLQSQDVLGNVIVDVPVVEMFGFFVGAGAGLGFNRTTNKLYSDGDVFETNTDRNGFAWMATAGLSVLPLHWLAIDVSYRYNGLGAVRWTDTYAELTSNNFSAQEVFLSFRFTLPSREPCGHKAHVPYKPKAMPEPEPVRKPVTKGPAYHPQKGAEYHPTKGAHYDSKGAHYEHEKGATYDSKRATRVKKSNKKTNYSVD
jgi:opacity protein-like surface antigen